ncbi:hypothetical protein B0H13DRAFT_1879536 [Mycena leptocephala]|nr:hypothetical protein B0H13DRAFT_1879536 [Mycena leptocephala]
MPRSSLMEEGLIFASAHADSSQSESGPEKYNLYAPIAGFDAQTGDGIELIFNEVEDAAVMMVVLQVLHPKAHADLVEKTKAADRMGKSGVNTCHCTGYCAAQHEDEDECRGMCTQNELVALRWEYTFCQPSYGYYLQTYENMFWTFLGRKMHGTMLLATTPLESLEDGPLRLRGGSRRKAPALSERAQRAERRAAEKDGGHVSTGKHVTAPAKNVAKANSYQAVRERRAARRQYWGPSDRN